MATLLAQRFPALDQVYPAEAAFLGGLLHDLVKAARSERSAHMRFHEYELFASSQPLGAVLVAVSWRIWRHGQLVAQDTSIQYA